MTLRPLAIPLALAASLAANGAFADVIDGALKQCSHTAMRNHIEKNLPPPLRQHRAQRFKTSAIPVPKTGNCQKPDTA